MRTLLIAIAFVAGIALSVTGCGPAADAPLDAPDGTGIATSPSIAPAPSTPAPTPPRECLMH
jgi:hypothetical protein